MVVYIGMRLPVAADFTTSYWSLFGLCVSSCDCISGSNIGGWGGVASPDWDEITTCVVEELYQGRV